VTSEFDLFEFVCEAIAQASNVDRGLVNADSRLLDLHVDSLAIVTVLAQVEAIYDVELTPEDVISTLELQTVADVLVRLEEILASKVGSSGEPSSP
jgi:acyl carrier protein